MRKLNKIIRVFLILENLFIAFIIFLFLFQINHFKYKFLKYLSYLDYFLRANFYILIFSLLFVILYLFLHIIFLKELLRLFKKEKNFWEIARLYFRLHYKRTFSPFGPLSPIINLNFDLKEASKIYLNFVLYLALGSSAFFLTLLSFYYPSFSIIILFILIPSLYLAKKNLFQNIHLKEIILMSFLAFLIELTSFLVFYFALLLFEIKIPLLELIIVYLIWNIFSVFIPFLHGTGASEGLTVLLIYQLGLNPARFLLGLIFYRLLITYLPLLGVSLEIILQKKS